MLTNILEQQGFSPLEARVYLATLELGQAPASQIARKLQENRVTVYSVLQHMVQKHQILTVMKNKVVNYSAISPKTLLKTAQEKADLISESMPEFLALSTLFNDKPSVQFYEGLDGLKLIYEDTLNYPATTLKAFLGYEKVDH
jgi:sugar-specific transcriptional regulator TrmB